MHTWFNVQHDQKILDRLYFTPPCSALNQIYSIIPGVTILFKKPTAKDPNLFSFLSPLSLGVWIYIVTAYLAVSLLLYVLAR